MVGIAELSSIFTSLQAAKDITEAMTSLRDSAAFQEKRIELQSKILDAQAGALTLQQDRASLIEKIRGLEDQVANLKAWEADKQRYQLQDLGGRNGAFAYVLKESAANGEPPHSICATCYARGKKTILQTNGKIRVHDHALVCPDCKTQVMGALPRS